MGDIEELIIFVIIVIPLGLLLAAVWGKLAAAATETESARRERQASIQRARDRQAQVELEQERRRWQYQVEANSLTCDRCGNVAYPIPDTKDRYACAECNHRFVGPKHSIPLPPQ